MKPYDIVEVTPPTGDTFFAIVTRDLSNSGIPVIRLNETLQHHIVNAEWCKPVDRNVLIGQGMWTFTDQ